MSGETKIKEQDIETVASDEKARKTKERKMVPFSIKTKTQKEFLSLIITLDKTIDEIIEDLYYASREFIKRVFPDLVEIISEEELDYLTYNFHTNLLLDFLTLYTVKVGRIIKDEKSWNIGAFFAEKTVEANPPKEKIEKFIELYSKTKKKIEESINKEREKQKKKFGYSLDSYRGLVLTSSYFEGALSVLNDYLSKIKETEDKK